MFCHGFSPQHAYELPMLACISVAVTEEQGQERTAKVQWNNPPLANTAAESPSVTGLGFGVGTASAYLESLFLFCILNLTMLTFISLFFTSLEPKVVFWVGYISNHITYKKIML